jgi:hypothetical protein
MKVSKAAKLCLEYHKSHSKENTLRAYRMVLTHDLPPLFVPLFKLEFVQYSPVKTITKKDQSVKSL